MRLVSAYCAEDHRGAERERLRVLPGSDPCPPTLPFALSGFPLLELGHNLRTVRCFWSCRGEKIQNLVAKHEIGISLASVEIYWDHKGSAPHL